MEEEEGDGRSERLRRRSKMFKRMIEEEEGRREVVMKRG